MRIRFEFSKDSDARYVSHLDMIRLFERSARRAGLPLAFSQGFNPHPKMSFGPALALGTASDREYVDISFTEEMPVETVASALQGKFPAGVRIIRAAVVTEGAEALNALINRAKYIVKSPLTRASSVEELESFCTGLMSMETIIVQKKTKKGIREKDIKPGVYALECCLADNAAEVFMELLQSSQGSVRPEDVVNVLISLGMPISRDYLRVRRAGLYSCRENACIDPLQVLS